MRISGTEPSSNKPQNAKIEISIKQGKKWK